MEIKDVENLAELARLELNQDEKDQILNDMEGILKYVKQIEGVNVPDRTAISAANSDGGNNPSYELKNVWREDVPENGEYSTDGIKAQFPNSQDGYLKVKKIL